MGWIGTDEPETGEPGTGELGTNEFTIAGLAGQTKILDVTGMETLEDLATIPYTVLKCLFGMLIPNGPEPCGEQLRSHSSSKEGSWGD